MNKKSKKDGAKYNGEVKANQLRQNPKRKKQLRKHPMKSLKKIARM